MKKEFAKIIITGLALILTVLIIWFFWRNDFFATFLILMIGVYDLYFIGSRKLAAVFIVSALGGVFIEAIAIYSGAWSYHTVYFFGVPLWLLPAWGNAGIFIVSFYKLFGKVSFLEKSNSR